MFYLFVLALNSLRHNMVSQNACLHLAHASPFNRLSRSLMTFSGIFQNFCVVYCISISFHHFCIHCIFTISYTLSGIGFPLFFPFHFLGNMAKSIVFRLVSVLHVRLWSFYVCCTYVVVFIWYCGCIWLHIPACHCQTFW